MKLNKNRIDFGLVPECKQPIDSLILYNKGTASFDIKDVKIIGGNGYFLFARSYDTDTTIKAGDSIKYFIMFNGNKPPDGQQTAQLFIKTTIPHLDSIYINMSGERFSVNVDLKDIINFSSKPLGAFKDDTLIFTNKSKSEINIGNYSSNNLDFTITPQIQNIKIAPDSSYKFIIRANFNKEGYNSGLITFLTDSPCSRLDTVKVEYVGLQGNLVYTPIIDFGKVPYCESRKDSIILKNIGSDTIKIVSMGVPFFQSDNINSAEIAPGDSVIKYIYYDASLKNRPLYDTTELFGINLSTGSKYIPIKATRLTPNSEINPINFGMKALNVGYSDNIEIKNKGRRFYYKEHYSF